MDVPVPIVYVVDDDESVRTALARLMKSAGMAVQTFASAEDFLGTLRSGVRGCVILDMHMPGMNGLDVQARLARLRPALPVIFITAYEDAEAEAHAGRAGAAAFLRKPFDDETLLGLLRRLIGGAGSRSGPPANGPRAAEWHGDRL